MSADRLPRAAQRSYDPLRFAGIIICNLCGRRGYPVDAGWMADDLLLVTFDSPCWHNKEPITKLVTPSQLELADPEPARCQAKVRNGPHKGQQCSILARPGSQFCGCQGQQAGA
jgi:hypothetical protein